MSTNNFAKDNGLNNVAVIIGIDDYNLAQDKFKPLKNAAKDAIDLAKVLQDSYDYTVHLFTDKQSDLSFANPIKEPTLETIDTFLKEDLREIVDKSTLKTCLLFYFAGHGVAEKSDTDPKGFLIPQDAKDDSKTWLEMKDVYTALSESKCHHVLAILDSCYSGAFLWAIGGRKGTVERPKFYKEHLQRYRTQPTQLLMYSAAYNQEASDGSRGDKSGNSPFAAALCSVLKNNIDQTKSASHGIITTSQLFSEIQKDLLDAHQQPGVYPLKREFVGREYIFYNPEFDLDKTNLEPAPAINEQNNPYRGLQAFEERHVATFRGRAALTDKLSDRLHLPVITNLEELNASALEAEESAPEAEESTKPALPLTIVLGNSGSGKSSLVKAGLLPTLRDKSGWRILDPIRPGADPFMSLARAFLPIAHPNLLEDQGLQYLDQYFEKLTEQQKALEEREAQANTTKESQPSSEQSAKIQFAQSWKKADPDARLLIVRDYYEEKNNDEKKNNRFNIQRMEQSGLPPIVETFYSNVEKYLTALAEQLEKDSQEAEPTKLAAIVQTWYQHQTPNSRLQTPNSRFLLVVDQLEELLTLDRSAKAKSQTNKDEESVSDRFLKTLLAALKALNAQSDQFRVVMTLRSDFEPRFLTTRLKEWLPYSRFPVRPMSTDELRQAIEEPAQAHALEFKPPQLVGQLIDELGQPGALPLLSFVLSELYLDLAKDRQSGDENRDLVLDKNKHAGGIAGFLSGRADTEYEALKNEFGEEGKYYQAMMQQVMLRMVTIEGGSSAKRRVPKSELDYPKQEDKYCKKVIERLVSARLLIEGRDKGEPYYEPAHDYLISGWALLQTWIEQKKEDLALQQRLIPAAKEWNERRDPSPAVQNKQPSGKVTRWSGVRHKGLQLVSLTAYGVGRSLFLLIDGSEYIKRKVVGLRRNKKDPDRRYEKPADYLWDDDPRINQLSFLLDSRSWLNNLESEFVRYSVVQKQQIRTLVGVGMTFIGFVIVATGIAAINGQRKAQLEQAKTAVESANANLQTGQDLEAIKNVISGSSAIKQDVRLFGIGVPNLPQSIAEQNNLQDAQNNLQEALFKSVYLTKERNSLSLNRGNIYQIATAPATVKETKVKIATVEEGDSVRLLDEKGKQLFQLSACPSQSAKDKAASCEVVYSVALGAAPKPKDNKGKGNMRLATGGDNGVIYLWNVKSDGTIEGKLNSAQLQEKASVDQLAYNATGTTLALVQNGNVLLSRSNGSISSSKVKFDKLNKDDAASSIAFNPQKEQLAIGLNDGKIEIWDVSKQPKRIDSETIDAGIKAPSLAFSQDGKTIAVGGSGEAVKLFAVNGDGTIDPNALNPIDTHQPRTYNLAFLDSKQILTVGVSDTVGRYAINTHTLIQDQPLITAQKVEERHVKSVVYRPDGQLIATVADDNSIRLWDRQGKQLARSAERDYYVQSLAFSPDGRMLVSSGSDEINDQGNPAGAGVIELWKISNQQLDLGQPIATIDAGKRFSASKNVEFVNSNEIVSLGADDGDVTWFKIEKNNALSMSGKVSGYDYLAKSRNFAFSPTGQGAIITKEGALELLENAEQIYSDSSYTYTSVAFSPDGTKLATGSTDGRVQIWQVPLNVDGNLQSGKTPQLDQEFQTHPQAVNTLAFQPDDPNTLMTGGADGEVKFWDLSQNMPDSSRLALRDVQTIAFSPSNPIAASQPITSSLQPNSIFGGLPGGDLLQPIWGQVSHFFGSLNAAAPQPVQRLAAIDQDKQLKLWDVQPDGSAKLSETKLESKVKAELAKSRQLVLSPDGNLLVAIDAQNTIKAWNLESGQAIDWQAASPPVESIKATDAKFSQDGKVLITLGEDKKLKLWNVTNDSIQPRKPSKIQSPEAQAARSTAQPENSIDNKRFNALYRVAISPDNELAILFKNKQLIEFWDKSLDQSGEFKLPQTDSQILFSPDGKIIATIGKDNDREVIRLWDRASRDLTKTLELPPVGSDKRLHPEQVKVVFSPDSHLLIATNSTGTLSLWDTEGKSIFQFPEAINSASFTTDGKHLSVVLPNGELSSWSIDRAELLAKACEMRDKFKQNDTTSIDPQACSTNTAVTGAAFSTGEKLLIPSVTNLNKLAGINRFQQNNFSDAAQLLSDSLQAYPNDPEALIYYNNAEILKNSANTEVNIHTIAVPVPIGTNPDAAQEILRGVAQAQKEINAKGVINGKLLRVMIANDSVMIANDDENLAIARQVAHRLVDDPEIDGVVGHYASDTTKAANEIYETGKLVSISPVSTAVDLFKTDRLYAFRTVPNDQMAAKRLAEYMVQQEKTKAVVFYNSTSTYSNSIQQAFETELSKLNEKGDVVKRIDLSKPFDAAQEMKTIMAQYSDKDTAIALFPNSGVLPKAIEIMKENLTQPKKFLMLGGDDVYSPLVLKDAGDAAVGLVVAVPWHINGHSHDPFVTTSRSLWKADVNWRSATAYDAVKALAQGLERNPTREGLAAALRAADFEANGAAASPVKFQAGSGDRDQPSDLVQVDKVEGAQSRSKTGFDFNAVSTVDRVQR